MLPLPVHANFRSFAARYRATEGSFSTRGSQIRGAGRRSTIHASPSPTDDSDSQTVPPLCRRLCSKTGRGPSGSCAFVPCQK